MALVDSAAVSSDGVHGGLAQQRWGLAADQARSQGVTLHYHGDFDGEGVRIAANVMARTGAGHGGWPATDYLAAVR